MWLRLKLIFTAIGVWILPLLKALGSNVGKIILKEAISVVKEVAVTMSANANANAKRKAAFDIIVANLKNQGLKNIETSVVNAAIETAVQFLKDK